MAQFVVVWNNGASQTRLNGFRTHMECVRVTFPKTQFSIQENKGAFGNVCVQGAKVIKWYTVTPISNKVQVPTGYYLIEGCDEYNSALERSYELQCGGETEHTSVVEFLHGGCEAFAIALNQIFGYPIYQMFSEETEEYVHSFCLVQRSNQQYYIDARGITTDFRRFVYDYEDWCYEPNLIQISVKKLQQEFNIANKPIGLAKEFVKRHIDYYTLYS